MLGAPSGWSGRRWLQIVILADAVFELAVGAFLLAATGRVANWFDVEAAVIVTAAWLFAGAAVGMLILARQPDRRRVRDLAIVNIALGAAGWVIILTTGDRFAGEGRSLLMAVCDAAILIGLAEAVAVRRFKAGERT